MEFFILYPTMGVLKPWFEPSQEMQTIWEGCPKLHLVHQLHSFWDFEVLFTITCVLVNYCIPNPAMHFTWDCTGRASQSYSWYRMQRRRQL